MPDVADYFPRPLPGALALSSTPCNLDAFVFAQCFAEPRWTVQSTLSSGKRGTGSASPTCRSAGLKSAAG